MKILSEKTEKNIQLFKKELKKIKLSNNNDLTSAESILDLHKAMLKLVVDMISIGESQYRQWKGERAAYALNSLINQARELASDIRSMQEVNSQTEKIAENIILPSMTMLVQNNTNMVLNMKKQILSHITKKDVKAVVSKIIDNLIRSQASYINELMKSMQSRIRGEVKDEI